MISYLNLRYPQKKDPVSAFAAPGQKTKVSK